jgi:hypothetical protein
VSACGEGLFEIDWKIRLTDSRVPDFMDQAVTDGNLIMAYGIPERLNGDNVVLKDRFVSPISKRCFTTQKWKYTPTEAYVKECPAR